MTIPDGLPTLAKGSHPPNAGSACVMEYVSVIAGEQWTDSPMCTIGVIAGAARGINDAMTDEQRQGLLVLVPRLLTANVEPGNHGEVTTYLLARARQYAASKGFVALINAYDTNQFGLLAEVCAYEAQMGRGVEFLTFLLDRFDAFVGQREPVEVTDAQYIAATKEVSRYANPVTRYLNSTTLTATFH